MLRRPSKGNLAAAAMADQPSSPATPIPFSRAANSSSSLPATLLDQSLPLPKLIVFDLDYTLWPFWVDTHVTPPLKPNTHHSAATDRYGEDFGFYRDVPSILQLLPRIQIKLAVASRTSAPSVARDLLKLLHLPADRDGEKPRKAVDAFDGGMEIYPGSKIKHMELIHKRTGVAYEDILFFDDESRNRETEKLGVTMQLITSGVSWDEIAKGVDSWRKRRGFSKKK